MAYCTGVRLGALVRLTVGDLALAEATLTIRETQFCKTRRLPLPPTVMTGLQASLHARARAQASVERSAPRWWNDHTGQGDQVVTLGPWRREVIRRAGLKPAVGRVGPRFHALRHTVVVQRMRAWSRAGIKPQARLPSLATSLGHQDVAATVVSLPMTQDLLQAANTRCHTGGAPALDPPHGDRLGH